MLLFNRYEYNPQTDLLGKGGFSRVYKAVDKKFNRLLALKIYKTSDLSDRYSPIAEIQRVIDLDHPNISRYIDIDEIEKEDPFGEIEKIQVCVMELLDGGNIAKFYQQNKDLIVLKKLLTDVLHGLDYLHKNGIIHRDIKPANILIKKTVDGPVAKITDFGISKKSDTGFNSSSSSSALIVSIPYMAPEQLNSQKYGIDEKISYNIDFWSLGVTVYETIAAEVLFKTNDQDSSEQIMTNIMSPELPAKVNLLPEPFRTFVSFCMIKDAKQRIQKAETLISILNTNYPESAVAMVETEPPVDTANVNNEKTYNEPGDKNVIALDTAVSQEPTEPEAQVKEEIIIEKDDLALVPVIQSEEDSADTDDTRVFTHIAGKDQIDDFPAKIDMNKKEPGIVPPVDEVDGFSGKEEEKKSPGVLDDDGIHGSEKAVLTPAAGIEEDDDNNDDTKVLSNPSRGKQSLLAEQDKADGSKIFIDSVKGKSGSGIFLQKDGPVTLFSRYTYLPAANLIGKGGFSRVYKAYDNKLSRFVALKIYKTGEFADNYSPIAEIRRVINLDHPNICRYLDIEEIEKENPFGENEKIQVCVMELLDSGNLAEYYNTGKDLVVLKKLVQDVLSGLVYLHKKGIVHRDIKPANILVKDGMEGPIAKITDFGISKITDSVNNNSSSALVVSIPYMAPEQLNPKRYGIDERISFNLDLWSLGVTIYEVIAGNALFKNNEQESSEQIMTNIMSPGLPEKIKDLPEPFRNIVAHCVVKNARERSQKAEELLSLLNIPMDIAAPVAIIPVTEAAIISPEPVAVKQTIEPESLPEPIVAKQTVEPGPLPEPIVAKQTVEPEPLPEPQKIAEYILPPEEPVLEQEIKTEKRRFSTIDFSSAETEIKAKKSIGYLKIMVAAAAVIFLVIVTLYIRSSFNRREVIDEVTDSKAKQPVTKDPKRTDTASAKPTIMPVQSEPKRDSSLNIVPADKPEDNLTESKKKKKTEERNTNPGTKLPAIKNNPPEKNTAEAVEGSCMLELTASEECTLTVNSFDYGLLKANLPIRIPLHLGKNIVEAVRTKDNLSKSRMITITPAYLNKKYPMVFNF